MLRIVTLAATAALLAAPASAEDSIQISTAGKTSAQLRAEVYKAATTLCRRESIPSGLEMYLQRSCVNETAKAAFAQVPGLTLAQR